MITKVLKKSHEKISGTYFLIDYCKVIYNYLISMKNVHNRDKKRLHDPQTVETFSLREYLFKFAPFGTPFLSPQVVFDKFGIPFLSPQVIFDKFETPILSVQVVFDKSEISILSVQVVFDKSETSILSVQVIFDKSETSILSVQVVFDKSETSILSVQGTFDKLTLYFYHGKIRLIKIASKLTSRAWSCFENETCCHPDRCGDNSTNDSTTF